MTSFSNTEITWGHIQQFTNIEGLKYTQQLESHWNNLNCKLQVYCRKNSNYCIFNKRLSNHQTKSCVRSFQFQFL